MTKKRLLSLSAAAVMLLGMASLAMAGIPDETLSTSSSGSGCITITPAGTGPSLASRGLTVTVTVVDANGDPIAGYPFQDVWLGDSVGGVDISLCNGGSAADANTNASGVTTISGIISGGGWTLTGMQVRLAGVPIVGPALLIDMNSADITGDLFVNLADVGEFSIDFNNVVYDFRSDFTCDGFENLADVGELAIANGQICP